MVKATRIGTGLYLLFVLYLVVYSQARCSSGQYTPDAKEPMRLTNVNVGKDLPKNWAQQAFPAEHYRAELKASNAALIALPAAAPEGLKKLERLEALRSVGPVDATLFAISKQAAKSHDRANYNVRKTAMRAGGVAVYSNNRGSSSGSYSSSSYSTHK
ncbi:MAG: hypothetical protein KC800_13875 [Candidatus Eremiobacteraeota bacterium]|nr:hypothetical protein [Candidatus Eremiobacteraeota bacterium]